MKRLAELHGGRVEATSPGLNRGSEFTVRLPAIDPGFDATAPAHADANQHRPTPRRVLVIEDSRDAADSLVMLLELEGHEVRHASDAHSALETLKSFAPELMLIDIGLPDLDGYQLAREIRRGPHHSATLYALTGYGQDEDRAHALQAGFDGHLTKPVAPAALLALVGGQEG